MFEVMNGLAGTDATLAVLPGGTGNDYARCTGLPVDFYEGGKVALSGSFRYVDIGRLSSGKHFISVIGAGFDAEVAANVNRYPKYFGGTIPYMAGIVKTLWQYTPRDLEIEMDGRRIVRKSLLIAVGLASSYGGGMKIVPDAKVDDGLFDVCIGGDLGRAEVLGLVPQIYKGTHVNHPKVEMARCRHIAIASKQPTNLQAEGELIGQLPVEITILPGHLKLACPQQALAQAAD
jgi:YegS/Rv2252/BmrU family lipid kinase